MKDMKRISQQFYQGKIDLEKVLEEMRTEGCVIIQSTDALCDVIWLTRIKRYQCLDHCLRGAILGILDCHVKLNRWLDELDDLEEWMRRERDDKPR